MPERTAAVVGATGAVGQRFVQLLAEHPWFRLTEVAASGRSAGKSYREATNWKLDVAMPEAAASLEVKEAGSPMDADIVFSAIPGGLAGDMEKEFAARGHKVFSNARDHRMVPGIPLVITEVNAAHFKLLDERKTDGFIVTNGNCSGIIATLALAPLHRTFGITAVHAVTLQALSGAGYPGVPSLDMVDNLVPYIGGEEEKVESEPRHMLGKLKDGTVTMAPFQISATCTRVPVIEGHSMAMHVKLDKDAGLEDVAKAIQENEGLEQLDLPSAPARALRLLAEPDRPQPRRDRDAAGGMQVSVGRLRADPLMDIKFFASGSNTIRGAAGQSILNAEYLVKTGTA